MPSFFIIHTDIHTNTQFYPIFSQFYLVCLNVGRFYFLCYFSSRSYRNSFNFRFIPYQFGLFFIYYFVQYKFLMQVCSRSCYTVSSSFFIFRHCEFFRFFFLFSFINSMFCDIYKMAMNCFFFLVLVT